MYKDQKVQCRQCITSYDNLMRFGNSYNLPSISGVGSTGQVNPNPTYGTDVNQLLLESVNEFGLDQLVTEPTHGSNVLDLIFSSHPESIANIEVIPGTYVGSRGCVL